METDLGHGPRISGEELERRTVELYSAAPEAPSRAEERELRRRELDLAIDHKLGTGFPPERRGALWAVQERIERRRVRLMLRHLVRRLWPRGVERGAQRLAGFAVDEYATVLDPQELEAFFGAAEARTPRLPIDREGGGDTGPDAE